jgi:hypothetical protein
MDKNLNIPVYQLIPKGQNLIVTGTKVGSY